MILIVYYLLPAVCCLLRPRRIGVRDRAAGDVGDREREDGGGEEKRGVCAVPARDEAAEEAAEGDVAPGDHPDGGGRATEEVIGDRRLPQRDRGDNEQCHR